VLDLLFGPPKKRAASVWEDESAWTPSVFGWGGARTRAGVTVDEDVALTYSAVWCATRLLSESEAFLPLLTYKRTGHGDRELATKHSNYHLLKSAPAPNMGSMAFRVGRTVDQINGGNGFAEIERADPGDPSSPVVALWPIDHRRVSAARGDELAGARRVPKGHYLVKNNDGTAVALAPHEMLHVPGALSRDGVWGRSVIAYGQEGVGFGLATERHGANSFGSGNLPRGIVFANGLKDREARNNFREEWRELHGKPDSNNVAILPTEAKFQQLSFSNEDSQYLQTRAFNVREVARWYCIPLYMLQEYEKAATYASIERLSIEYVTYSIMPWLKLWEEQINLKLFAPEEREEYFCEHLLTALLRGDAKSRYEAYQIALNNGFMSRNEVRRFENLNGLGDDGDKVFVQMNTKPIEQHIAAGAADLEARKAQAAQAARAAQPPPEPAEPAPSGGDELLDVPDVRQELPHTCGAACTQAVAEFFKVGENRTQADYARELGTNPADGTRPEAIVDWFNDHGFITTSGPGMTLEDLAAFHRAGKPVIVPVQMYGTTPEYDGEEARNEEGHYVTIIGVGLGQVFMACPVAGRMMMDAREFDRRWHDTEAGGVVDDHFGIAVGETAAGAEAEEEVGPTEPEEPEAEEETPEPAAEPVEYAAAVPAIAPRDDTALRQAAGDVLRDVLSRMYAKEAKAVGRFARSPEFPAKLAEWCREHESTVAEAVAPAVGVLVSLGCDVTAGGLAGRVVAGSKADLQAAYESATPDQFQALLAGWPERADAMVAVVLAELDRLRGGAT
jgi:HK97 family phage portal protein